MLAAADHLFAGSDAPRSVSMDAIAAEAGVGKGTLFRAFTSREALLDTLSDARLQPMRDAVEARPAPLGTDAAPSDRIVAFLDALVDFKLDNRHLMRAGESSSAAVLASERYRWMHGHLTSLLEQSLGGSTVIDPPYAAHALLVAFHIDFLDALLSGGKTVDDIHLAQARQVRALLSAAGSR